jgi:hypothetical protein
VLIPHNAIDLLGGEGWDHISFSKRTYLNYCILIPKSQGVI